MPVEIVCAVEPLKPINPVELTVIAERAPVTLIVPSPLNVPFTVSVLPALIDRVLSDSTVKPLTETSGSGARITGSFGIIPFGITALLVAVGTCAGLQLVAIFQLLLVAPVQVTVLPTFKVAEAVPPAPPSADCTFPVVFIFAPNVVALTLTEKLQVVFAGIVAPKIEMLVSPALGVKFPVEHEFPKLTTPSTSTPDGKLSVTPTPVSVVGVFAAGFVIEIVKVEVPLTRIESGEKLFVMVGGATTVRLALVVGVLPSSAVESVTELFFTPAVVPVTSTLNIQLAFAAKVAPVKLIELVPAVAVTAPPHEPVTFGGVATTSPTGRLSVKETFVKEITELLLVIEKVKAVVPFKGIVGTPNALVNVGAAMTIRVAVLLVRPVPPSVELIAVVVLFFAPSVLAVTSTLIVQLELTGSESPDTLIDDAPAAAEIVAAPQLFTTFAGEATTKPSGSGSV